MTKKITLIAALIVAAFTGAHAQLTVGANTAPGSTMDVRGSVAAQYRTIAASGAIAATDFYVAYTGSAAGTLTLPAAGSGTAPLAAGFKGRLYTIKNATAAQTLTITPAGSETIDGRTSIAVGAGQSVQLVATGNTPAAWEIVSFNSATATGCVPGYMFAKIAVDQYSLAANNTVALTTVLGNNISNTGGVFTLTAGNTYELTSAIYVVNFSNPTNAYLGYRWYDITNGADLGTIGECLSIQQAGANSGQPTAVATVKPATNITVALRIVYTSGVNASTYLRTDYSFATIRQVNACAGGSGGGNATAGNGLTATAGNVALGGTLTQATTINQNLNALSFNGGIVAITPQNIPAGNGFFFNNGNAGVQPRIYTPLNMEIQAGSNPYQMVLGNNGNVSIGSSATSIARLTVTGVSGGNAISGYASYFTPGSGFTATSGTNSGYRDLGIYADGSIASGSGILAAVFSTSSDARLKNVIGLSDGRADLAKLMKVRITDYTMRDKGQFGSQKFKKVIAQEVEQIFPEAVRKERGFLPDVYQLATAVNAIGNGQYSLTLRKAATALKVGDKLKLVSDENGEKYTVITGVSGTDVTVKSDNPLNGKIFLYGTEHNDMRTVDYEAIAMLNVSATQELARQVEALKAENARLALQLKGILQKLEANTKQTAAVVAGK